MTSRRTIALPLPGDFAAVPAGLIAQRDARTDTTRQVAVAGFELSRTTVTAAQYGQTHGAQSMPADGLLPASGLTWFDAVAWCNHASEQAGFAKAYVIEGWSVTWRVDADGFRLPTEAEWEHACRATTTTPTYGPLHDIAWTAADGIDGPQPVAGKTPNDFGLFDTIGNVWEWCWNYADTARYGDYRSLRGGGWADQPWSCRASVRRGSAPDAVIEDVGFRVARGAVGAAGEMSAQGWSENSDRLRARITGPRPVGWTPLSFANESSRGWTSTPPVP